MKSRFLLVSAFLIFAHLGLVCSQNSDLPPVPADLFVDADPLFPLETLFSDNATKSVRLHPSGEQILFLAPWEGNSNVFIANVSDVHNERALVTTFKERTVRASWTHLPNVLLLIVDNEGDENYQLYSADCNGLLAGGRPAQTETETERVSAPEYRNWTVPECVVTPLGRAAAGGGDGSSSSSSSASRPVRTVLAGMSYRHPEVVVIGENGRTPVYFDLYKVNLLTGERELVYENNAYTSFRFDLDLQVRLLAGPVPGGSVTRWDLVLPSEASSSSSIVGGGGEGTISLDRLQTFRTFGFDEELNSRAVGFDESGDILFFADGKDTDTAALKKVNVSRWFASSPDAETEEGGGEGEETILFHRESADAESFLRNPTTRIPEAVRFEYTEPEWVPLPNAPPHVARALEVLSDAAKTRGLVSSISRSTDDKTWLVVFSPTDGPVLYEILRPFDISEEVEDGGDGQTSALEKLFVSLPELADLPLSRREPVVIPTRDNRTMVSYLSLPLWEQRRRDAGLPPRAFPMVLTVHGGPWSRDRHQFDHTDQIMQNRGYAVLSVNFRGSTGFGRDFLTASYGEWGGQMHDDLLDAVMWAERENIALPNRTCIYGGSYGGYAALAGLTLTPTFFACGVSVVGISNLVTLANSFPPYWLPYRAHMLQRIGGDPADPEGRAFLESVSPLFFADRIQRPLLIVHGANDPRVPQGESDQIVEAMQLHGTPVTYLLFEDEGHGLSKEPNRLAMLGAGEAFLHQNLGGRCLCDETLLGDARRVARADTQNLLAPAPSSDTPPRPYESSEEGEGGVEERSEQQGLFTRLLLRA
uniref:Peptidase S9 prolyl oligopeptidase catalytic domain-containing protein n=1 Tax=Chromera velia CCMP2878 TaxID=1169474 RepID=A0A0G4FG76_9ALVE|eukprot:Cvel_16785.t1-p1 / transcript=Cvel_16785.t1 / gene=Cvel_16785 / organism=Chromera_velia_CCMP2878 / gene_product=Dipeptidyl peptidase family member 6, putative / transcript_product=Dipeptidyl peptidase family member 6, putative / location=Cvel_scaffold1310:19647-23771(-) / protein_length=816 / sequence_SO=supercontig / SO=protein_coding / is_pseudo=false